MRKQMLRTVLRRCAILALLCSAVFLLLQTDYLLPLRSASAAGSQGSAGYTASGTDAYAALLPLSVAARHDDGTLYAAAAGGSDTRLALRHFSALLGEALGSAGAPETVTEASFRSVLDRECFLVNLGIPIPLDLLSGWLGTEAGEIRDLSADLLCLSLKDESVTLGLRDADGAFRVSSTAALQETLRARIADFQAGPASLAYEYPVLRGIEPFMVIVGGAPELASLTASSVTGDTLPDQLEAAVGMNHRLVSSYYDADGTLVLNEDGRTLRLGSDGMLSYRAEESTAADSGPAKAVVLAYSLAEACAGQWCGDADLMFSGVEESKEGTYTVSYDYSVNGIPILQPEGHAMTIVVAGGAVRTAQLLLRHYSLNDETETALPALQAAAAAVGRGRNPALVYLDSGDRVRCDWVRY